MKDIFSFQITIDQINQRIDKVLSSLAEISSRSRALQLIESQRITVNGKNVKASYKVKPGDSIQIHLPPPSPSNLVPLNRPLNIIFEDDDLIVINKPSGLVVHPAAGHAQDTLVNILLFHVKKLSMGFGENRPGIVHRLDKETSGLLVVAKNDFAHQSLSRQFKERTIQREYWALVYGHPKSQSGKITTFLARHPSIRKKFASIKTTPQGEQKGKKAITHFEVIQKFPSGISLLKCRLETGRTHQIRIHLSESGHAIVGDKLYGTNRPLIGLKNLKVRHCLQQMERIGLHAHTLGFQHPTKNCPLLFHCDWPEDLKELILLLS
ncbi:MAG: RluA family pseudouridine synthase [Bdellovibrionales bacterium]|nr:RluA family pseudouridine synthase [Bdellovibrionales bacterium]